MNKVILIGNLTRDPEYTTTASGIAMCRFTVAVSRRFKNTEGNYDTDFLNCVAWRNTADFCNNYAKKGMKVSVVGSIQTRTYDAEDGSKRYATDIVVDDVELLTPKGSSTGDEMTRKETVSDLQPIEDDSLPF